MNSELLTKIKSYSDKDLSTFLLVTSCENINNIVKGLLEENEELNYQVENLLERLRDT